MKSLKKSNVPFLLSTIVAVVFLIMGTWQLLIKDQKITNTNTPIQATSSATINNPKDNTQPTTSPLQPTQKPKITTPIPQPIPQQNGRSFRIPILTYHFIGNNPNPEDKARDNLSVTPDKFEQQMEYLSKNGFSAISFDTLYAALQGVSGLPSKPVILTFDDGYIDFYHNAFPILRRYNMHAISFIPTGLVGTSYYMNWSQIKEIDSTGIVSFQSHSVNHPNLSSLPEDQLRLQLSESKKTLEAQLVKPVNTLAYPYGISDGRVWQAAKNAGYIGAVGTWYGTTSSEGTIYNMPRIKVGGGIDINTFASRL